MRRFDKQLQELNNMMLEMGALVEKSITMAAEALTTQNLELAKLTIEAEDDIDQIEKDIEALCMKLLLQQQPVASDLRIISATMKMITDLERIGDQACDISEIVIMMGEEPHSGELVFIPKMAAATVKMVTDSIDAFVKKDLELAKSVINYDDEVDDLFENVRADIISHIRSDSMNAERMVDFLMIGKYFERIGDHACNVAGWVVYSIDGTGV